MRRPVLPVLSVATAAALLLGATAPAAAAGGSPFRPVTTFAVDGEVAEIVTATPDGRTLLYTDSALGRVGIVDLSDPEDPEQTGTIEVGGSPTSVALTEDGRRALVVVDTTEDLTRPSGTLLVVDLRTQRVLRTIQLGGQPDSIDVGPSGDFAAIAIENQRDEERVVAGVEGGLPQQPAGFLAVVELRGPVASWSVTRVSLSGLRGARYPQDPEPEYVDIDRHDLAAVTLQENNAIALVDLAEARVVRAFSAGAVHRSDADTTEDGAVRFDDRLRAPREPDTVQWTPDGNLLTADEGDLAAEPSGGRGWTVFRPDGRILTTSGGAAEKALARAGYYPDDRSEDKGAEFEGAEVGRFAGTDHAFIGAERGNAVLVYRFGDERRPTLVQVLPTGSEPEGLLAIERRGLFLTSNEADGTLSIFALDTGTGGYHR